MRLHGCNVLVTGAGGFVGQYLCPALTAAGARVHGTGVDERSIPRTVDHWHVADLLDAAATERAVASEAPDVVVHLAGQSSAATSFENPIETYRVNAIGTWTVLEAVRRHSPRARVLVVGTGEVYGPQAEGTRVSEDSPFRPVSPYALSKAAADALSEAFARRHGLDVIRTRSFGHTGPGQSHIFAVPSFARQIAEIEAGRGHPLLRVGNLDVTRDLSDVRDVVAGYLRLLEHGSSGAAYNVCRGDGVRMAEVVHRLITRARVAIRVEVDPGRVRPADLTYLVGDPGAIHRDTGWRASIPLDQTLQEVLADWRSKIGMS